MRILLLLSLCAVTAWASDPSDYDDEDDGVKQILLTNMGPTEVLFEMEDWTQSKV